MFTKCHSDVTDLRFRNISVNVGCTEVLCNVSGHVENGGILGLFGPKGCGKTTLVSVLAGLTDPSNGEVLVGATPLGKASKKIAFCQAEDHFLPTITVEETLKYTAILRLPAAVPPSTKVMRVREAIDLLQLDMYRDVFVQFLDKATKKRLAIACEMLTNPAVLLIDEPVLGLNFKETLDMMKLLQLYIEKTSRILIIATSTCPGIMYQMCSRYMFLYKAKVAFHGTTDELLELMIKLDLQHPICYSPPEYLLELLCEESMNDTEPVQDRIVQAFQKLRIAKDRSSESRKLNTSNGSGDKENGNTMDHSALYKNNQVEEAQVLIESGSSKIPSKSVGMPPGKWETPYWHEFLVLLARNFHNSRRRILFPVGVVQNLYILVICVLIWWRPDRNEDTVKDRLGLFFFTVVQWAFFALLDAILTFPKEMKVVNRERKFGHYRLSAFCLAKTLSELPLSIIQPCLYMCVMYWVANLNGVGAFLSSIGVLILDVLAAQSIGLFVGAALQPPWTVSVVSLGLLSMMLWGGAFNTPPPWLRWGRFASFFFYGLNAFIYLELTDAPPIKCILDSPYHTAPVCSLRVNGTNMTLPEFPSDILLEPLNVDWPLWAYLTVLVGIMVGTRLLWYVIMRRKKLH